MTASGLPAALIKWATSVDPDKPFGEFLADMLMLDVEESSDAFRRSPPLVGSTRAELEPLAIAGKVVAGEPVAGFEVTIGSETILVSFGDRGEFRNL